LKDGMMLKICQQGIFNLPEKSNRQEIVKLVATMLLRWKQAAGKGYVCKQTSMKQTSMKHANG